MENNNRFEVFAVKLFNNKVFAVKTYLPDIISIERMKAMIHVDGFSFFVEVSGKEYDFTYENKEIVQPSKEIIKHVPKF